MIKETNLVPAPLLRGGKKRQFSLWSCFVRLQVFRISLKFLEKGNENNGKDL